MDRSDTLPFLKARLKALVNTPSPTGYTHLAADYLVQELGALGFSPTRARKGGVVCAINEGRGGGILLSAHIDTLGLMVRAVKPNGRLRITQVGGYPLQYAEQENLTVFTRSGRQVPGTLRMNQPAAHANRELRTLERTDENMEVVLDLRVSSQEEAEAAGIAAGDFIALDPRYVESGEGYIKSRHLDDKASAAVLLTLARAFREGQATCPRPVYLMFTNYEEVGHGAAAGHPPGISDMVAVDMGVVGDDLKTDEHKVSICAKDSGGPYNYDLTGELVAAAQRLALDYALDVYPYYGSDTQAALGAGLDARHALIGPGVAASHGYERTHEEGLWNTLRLLQGWLEKA
ncbi:MAG: M42 family metallopeptidase [Clostridiales bacterium]|nr:M42 family metallopeptidase [Clostridiales bacterium]